MKFFTVDKKQQRNMARLRDSDQASKHGCRHSTCSSAYLCQRRYAHIYQMFARDFQRNDISVKEILHNIELHLRQRISKRAPPLKWAVLIFRSKQLRNLLKRMKNFRFFFRYDRLCSQFPIVLGPIQVRNYVYIKRSAMF